MRYTNDSYNLRQVLDDELMENEKVLWEGKPSATDLLTLKDIFFVPFTIIWFGGVLFLGGSALLIGAPSFFKLVDFFFICVGAYMCVGRFFVKYKKRKRTLYVLTNFRALIFVGKTVKSVSYKEIRFLEKKVKDDGSGSIIFAKPEESVFMIDTVSLLSQDDPIGFMAIPDAEKVYKMILNQKLIG